MNLFSDQKTKFTVFALLVTVWALWAGYFQVFSIFPFHDDEGYLMMTIKQFLDGAVLYDQVYTQYGPAYYLYQQIIHTVFNLPVSHDITGLTTVVVWTLTALTCGVFAFRLTQSALAGVAAYVLTFLILSRTVHEPGHPQELCGWLVILILLLLTGEETARFRRRAAAAAIVLAFLFFIKINLGIFLGAACAAALVSSAKNDWLRKAGTFAAAALTALFPLFVLHKYLAIGWIKLCVSIAAAAAAAALVGALTPRRRFASAADFFAPIAAFAAASALILLATLANGTSPNALLFGTLVQHLKFGENFFQPAPIQRYIIVWSAASFAAACVYAYIRNQSPERLHLYQTLLKLGFGSMVIAFSLWGFENYFNDFVLISFAPPLLWIFLLQSPADERASRHELARLALFYGALLQVLQVFPIAGTQMAYASYLLTICGVISFYESLVGLREIFPAFGGIYTRTTAAAAALLLIVLCGYYLFVTQNLYRNQVPVGFAGASRLRMTEEKAAFYTFLVENLRSNCDNFVTMPGFFSLNFWTEISPPTTFNATAWMTLLDDSQQNAIIEKLETYPRVCAVYYPRLTEGGLRNARLDSFPLARYILDDFQTKAIVSEHRLMFKPGAAKKLIFLAKRDGANSFEFSLPARRGGQISRLQIYNWRQGRVVADSAAQTFAVQQENQPPSPLPLPISVAGDNQTNVFRATVENADVFDGAPPGDFLLRIFDETGSVGARLPFDETP